MSFRPHSLLAGLLFVLLLVAAASTGAASSHVTERATYQVAETEPTTLEKAQSGNLGEINGTEIRITLDSEGNADWEITGTFDIDTDPEEDAFQRLGTDFEEGEIPELGYPEIREAATRVDDRTERSMTVTEPERSATVDGSGEDRTGRLTLAFTWENFARVDAERIYVDEEVLQTDEGLWLRGLTADQELVVRPPAGYGVDDASVAPEAGGELRWTGEIDFSDTELRATFIGTNGNDTNQTDRNGGDNTTDDTSLLQLLVGGIIAVVFIIVLAVAARSIDLDSVAETVLADTESAEGAESEPESQPAPDEEPDEEESEEIDVELLSDEERVERLLESNGGRMKQANIVKETGWSNAKVSQLLSAMEEDERIDKLRIGRENLISFPDQDVADITDDE